MTLSAAGRRRKGAIWAAKVANWLKANGVDYVAQHTGMSEADFALDRITLEAKNQNPDVLRLGAALDQAREDAGGRYRMGAVLHHRTGKAAVEDAFVTMRADDWLELYCDAVRAR